MIGVIKVKVNIDTRSSKFPCMYYKEMGISCVHTKALLLALGRQSNRCATQYDITNYKEVYSRRIPSMMVAGKLSVDDTMAPTAFKRPAGRPAKKLKDQSYLKKKMPSSSVKLVVIRVTLHQVVLNHRLSIDSIVLTKWLPLSIFGPLKLQ
jgi:hypothetical protein